jgi:hypothetical protein
MTGTISLEANLADMTCFEAAKALYNAYTRMLMGGQKVQVRHGDYWVEYRSNLAGDMSRLKELYQAIRGQCDEAMACLPDLDRSNIGRGPAIQGRL